MVEAAQPLGCHLAMLEPNRPQPCRHLQGSVQRPLAPHHVANLPLPLQLGVDPALLPPSHHGDALFVGCLSQSESQPAVSIPQMLQTPPFEQLPQPWALAGSGRPQDRPHPGQMSDWCSRWWNTAPTYHYQTSFGTNPDCSAERPQACRAARADPCVLPAVRYRPQILRDHSIDRAATKLSSQHTFPGYPRL